VEPTCSHYDWSSVTERKGCPTTCLDLAQYVIRMIFARAQSDITSILHGNYPTFKFPSYIDFIKPALLMNANTLLTLEPTSQRMYHKVPLSWKIRRSLSYNLFCSSNSGRSWPLTDCSFVGWPTCTCIYCSFVQWSCCYFSCLVPQYR